MPEEKPPDLEALIQESIPVGTPPSGRQAFLITFREIRKELAQSDLSSPGVQKLLLDELEQADANCENYRAYVERFHDADKRAAVLEEQTKTIKSIDVFLGVGIGG
jgi:hypothetical protein